MHGYIAQNGCVMMRTATATLLATLPVLANTPAPDAAAPAAAEPPAAVAPVVPEQAAEPAPAPEQAAPAPEQNSPEQVEAPAPAPETPTQVETPDAPECAPAEPQPAAPAPEPEQAPAPAEPAPSPAPAPEPAVTETVEPAPAPAQPAAEPQPAPAPAKVDLSAAYRGIVKIEVATRKPDYATPWQTGRFGRGNGTGFMVSPGLFMTNAHVVADAERIYISPYADARKLKAHVKYVAHDADLALIEVEDASAFADVPCLEFSDTLPRLEDSVRAIGYPIGGNRLSVTRGIVSRIDTTVYAHPRNKSHLTVQVDAAINPGNSGGPVLMGDKVVGVAFQGLLEANSTGYMIPMPVIKRFLKDVEDGHYDKYVALGATFMPLINPAMRKHYNMPDNAMGTLVADVVKGSCSDGVLQPGDVVLAVNGHAVDSSAMIELDGERVQLDELAERAFKDEALQFNILRSGAEQQVEVRLTPLSSHSIMGQEYDALPRYVHFGGLVIQPLHRNVIAAHSLNSANFAVELSDYLYRGGSIEKSDIVILTKVLKDEVNARFSDYGRRIITKVNGTEVKGLSHLYELLYPANGQRPDYTVIEFAGASRPMVIDNKVIDAANARISAGYNVPAPACLK